MLHAPCHTVKHKDKDTHEIFPLLLHNKLPSTRLESKMIDVTETFNQPKATAKAHQKTYASYSTTGY